MVVSLATTTPTTPSPDYAAYIAAVRRVGRQWGPMTACMRGCGGRDLVRKQDNDKQ